MGGPPPGERGPPGHRAGARPAQAWAINGGHRAKTLTVCRPGPPGSLPCLSRGFVHRTDFALIRNEQRIFGYDNLGGWHRHPAEDPRSHIPCDKPSVEQVFHYIKSLVLPPTENPNDQS